MVVQHNIASMNANRYYNINNSGLAKSLEKLSSGYAINRAGDNAAGLAVSEKMRSQIGGLTQGVKNAQDGISMIQTYEGALTETDSILQRMKTLADQAANGTYQDDVDREAIQLEFNQLNDELDQIADTDFNGVVMLNGGTMADGLTQVNNKFDYSLKESQLIANAQNIANDDVKAAKKALDDAQAAYDALNYDRTEDGTAAGFNTIDNSKFTKTGADEIWKALNIVDGAGDADTSKINEIEITITKTATGWEATSGKDNTGKTYDATAAKAAVTNAEDATVGSGTGKGGVIVTAGGEEVNVLFDATDAKVGDTITLKFNNGDPSKSAPTNAGFKEDSVKVTGEFVASTDAPALTLDVTDDDMSATVKTALEKLNGIKVEYSNVDVGGADTFTMKIGGQTMDIGAATNTATFTADDGNGGTITYTFTSAGTDGSGTISITDGGTKVDLLTLAAPSMTNVTTDDSTSTLSAELAVSFAKYTDGNAVDVTAGNDENLTSPNAEGNKDALEAAQAAYDKAVAAKNALGDYDAAKAFLTGKGVSVSDSYDQATAPLTYTDHLVLQAGARTKDSVDFTFKYESDGLGNLKANLDCSSRTNGLGTKDLSLRTQKDANFAIDRIDNAINKVSMVRATFGATQNRLEHKIDNMNVTKENITSAESRIRDTDVSEEMANFTKNQILSQASQSMLAQANSLPQNVLQLLG